MSVKVPKATINKWKNKVKNYRPSGFLPPNWRSKLKNIINPLVMYRAEILIEKTKEKKGNDMNIFEAVTLAEATLKKEGSFYERIPTKGLSDEITKEFNEIKSYQSRLNSAMEKTGVEWEVNNPIEDAFNQKPQINIQPKPVVDPELSETESPETFDQVAELVFEPEKRLLGMPQNQAYILLAIVGLAIFYFITKPKK